MPTHRSRFPGRREEIHKARVWTGRVLDGDDRKDETVLIVSELGTNAISHTASAQGAWILTIDHSLHGPLRVSVTDSGSPDNAPHVRVPDPDAPSGRGLKLVRALAHRLTIHGDSRGHTVTAELTAYPVPAETVRHSR